MFGCNYFFPQEHMLELFFAMFYASVNVGAVLCMWFIPMVRSKFYQFMMIFSNAKTDFRDISTVHRGKRVTRESHTFYPRLSRVAL